MSSSEAHEDASSPGTQSEAVEGHSRPSEAPSPTTETAAISGDEHGTKLKAEAMRAMREWIEYELEQGKSVWQLALEAQEVFAE